MIERELTLREKLELLIENSTVQDGLDCLATFEKKELIKLKELINHVQVDVPVEEWCRFYDQVIF